MFLLRPVQASAVTGMRPDVTLEGRLEVVIEDAPPRAHVRYFLVGEHRRVLLRFTGQPPNLTTGAKVRVHGRRKKDGSFLVTTIERLPDDGRDEGVDLVEDQRLGPNGDGDQQIHLRDDFYLLSSHVRRGGLWEASRSRARVQRHTNLYNRQMM